MSFFDTLILDSILILFPISLMLIINGYYEGKTNKNILIDIASLTSFFLILKYDKCLTTYDMLLVNIPFIISILYKRKLSSALLSVLIVMFYYKNGSNLIVISIEYLIYITIFIIMKIKSISKNNIIYTFLFIKGVFLTIENFYILGKNNIETLIKIFISLTTFYLISMLTIKIIKIIEDFISLKQINKELEKEKKLKNSLFKITHEVKNPIAVCKGYLSMMDYNDIEKTKKYNEIIESELNRTLDIMDNFSAYTKVKITKDIMDVNYLLEETLESMKIVFKRYNVKVNYKNNEEIYIDGDYNRLKQVFVNILKNSCEAIEKNGQIDIKTSVKKDNVYIKIKDNGKGIEKENIKKIGELFYSSKEKGTGLGTALSKEIVKLHNGEITYKSELGKYTEVTVKLPKGNLKNFT